MNVFDTVRTILAVRRYREEPIPTATVRRIVEAGWLTASSVNLQPWHFIVVEDKDMLRRLGEAVRTGPYIAQAPLAIVAAFERDSPYGVSDTSRALQSMMLTAWDEGIGSNWTGFAGGLEGIKPILDIPDEMTVLAVVPFGYPAQPTGKGKKRRKPLAEVESRERYGRPFEDP